MSQIVVPQLGESVVEARVARWLKKTGDHVEPGEPVVELETDKIDLEVGADRAGVIASIARKEGEDVRVGEVLATIDASAGSSKAKGEATSSGADTPAPPEPKTAGARNASGSAKAPTRETAQPSDAPRATPTARRIAREHDVNIGSVQGSGAGGRVTKQDVEQALAPAPTREAPIAPTREAPVEPPSEPPLAPTRQPPVAPTSEAPVAPVSVSPIAPSDRREERFRMSKRRQTIARRLVEAQRNAAMLTTFNDIDMSAVTAVRERRKAEFEKQHGVRLGIMSFFVKATVAALREFPQLNAEIQGDEIVLKHYYDIGIAVGAEGGLVVPVLRDAGSMSFAEIERTIRDFSARAADRTLTLEDLMGGTFTITNGGVFGSLLSTPILNPPQVGILGLHRIDDRVVPANGQIVIRPMMYVALTYDHRLVDGREAVQFLARVKALVEDPANLLLAG